MPKILYVEDNDDNVYVMRGRLLRLGFEVVVAADGEQGVAMAETEAPDLILMDLRLPGIDGWEATRRIKAAPATKGIAIIALSAHAMAVAIYEKLIAQDKVDAILGPYGSPITEAVASVNEKYKMPMVRRASRRRPGGSADEENTRHAKSPACSALGLPLCLGLVERRGERGGAAAPEVMSQTGGAPSNFA